MKLNRGLDSLSPCFGDGDAYYREWEAMIGYEKILDKLKAHGITYSNGELSTPFSSDAVYQQIIDICNQEIKDEEERISPFDISFGPDDFDEV